MGGEILSHRNQRVVRLIDWLEHNRVRTRITAVQLTDQDVIEIKIKDYQDGLDLNALAAATHLDFFRRLLFRAKEYGETHGWGYGVPITIYQGRMDTPPKEDDPTVINIYSEIQDSKKLLDRQFDEAERFITEHYSDAFIGSESNGDRDHHDPAKGVPDRHQPTPLVWL